MKSPNYRLAGSVAVRCALFVVPVLVVLLANTAVAQQRGGEKRPVYRWVDEKGIAHYGDRIPAEYVRGESTVLNSQGVVVSTRAAQKSPEQIARETELGLIADKERQHDNFLLTTYQSVRDIEQLRDQRLQQMSDARRSIEAYEESLRDRLESLHERVQIFRPYNESADARRMPDQLAEDLVRTMKEVSAQRAQLAERMAEERRLREQFQVDIDRYRTLKSRFSSSR